ncbi:MAG: hypothetical protein ACK2T6_04625 [Anaerolineae bacterium]
MHRTLAWASVLALVVLVTGCESQPPTVTPAPAGDDSQQGATSIEITIEPPGSVGAQAGAEVLEVAVPPITLSEITPYVDADGAFSIDLPAGWPEQRQPMEASSDIRLGTYFQPSTRNALVTITQFDNGQAPTSLGATANDVMRKSGVMDQPNYLELGRESVIERADDAMRIELAYTRSDGVDMHSLVLFQVDGTTFSMVHVGVEAGSWAENEGVIRDILASYRVPASSG